jgi:RecA/RadA recombinase
VLLPVAGAAFTKQTLEPTIIERRVRLVVLDSVAALARADFAPGSLPERQRMLGQQVGGWRGGAGVEVHL